MTAFHEQFMDLAVDGYILTHLSNITRETFPGDDHRKE